MYHVPSARRCQTSQLRKRSATAWKRASGMAQNRQNDAMSALFQATVEATEEALYDALLMATPVSSRGGRGVPLPVDSVKLILQARGIRAPR